MATVGDWIHIGGDAWERYGTGTHYTVHGHNGQWVARGFLLDDQGTAHHEVEEPAQTLEDAKQIADQWESKQSLRETR